MPLVDGLKRQCTCAVTVIYAVFTDSFSYLYILVHHAVWHCFDRNMPSCSWPLNGWWHWSLWCSLLISERTDGRHSQRGTGDRDNKRVWIICTYDKLMMEEDSQVEWKQKASYYYFTIYIRFVTKFFHVMHVCYVAIYVHPNILVNVQKWLLQLGPCKG